MQIEDKTHPLESTLWVLYIKGDFYTIAISCFVKVPIFIYPNVNVQLCYVMFTVVQNMVKKCCRKYYKKYCKKICCNYYCVTNML